MLLTDVRVGDERPALLREIGLPAVVVAPSALPGWDGVPAVPADDRPGVAEAVEHLIALGHTRIAHVGGRDDLVHARSRREAWQSSLAAHHLPAGPCAEADFSAASGAAATARLLEPARPADRRPLRQRPDGRRGPVRGPRPRRAGAARPVRRRVRRHRASRRTSPPR
ncbi:hypothetical protein GCM10025868_44820 [Angustibacter aerolatus]|uniref:Transcriptional regulator LacI/GalR-like sensor domain-containing protein n=1 Tax=Angustibacter aerolatus TaxID=1162965 RepID=A0ABQ6JLT1_9ACTN|nr:substrate-binding domain-containing protein [Angustibacter aerolatus]GMA89232.1 hypothetical protein GCM10025868_44820 [Angustibacter aerolatus]